jgi:hypothetical protein
VVPDCIVAPLSETLSEALSMPVSFNTGSMLTHQKGQLVDARFDKASDKDIPEFFRAVHP